MNLSLTDQGPGNLWSKTPLEAQSWCGDTQNGSRPNGTEMLLSYERQMIQFAAEQEAELARLRSEYVFDSPPAVVDYLKTHRALPSLLMDSAAPLKRSFGGDSVPHLQVRTDGDSRILYAFVFWKGSLSSARECLESFDDTWWLASSYKGSGDVVFDYELA